jgi:hypothetical protein
MMRVSSLVAGFLIVFAAVAGAAGQERITFPGSRISVIPPPGFELVPGAFTLRNAADGSEFVFIDMPAETWDNYTYAFSDVEVANAELAAKHYTFATRIELPREGDGRFLVMVGTRARPGEPVTRNWFAALGPDPVVAITVRAPLEGGISDEAVLEALATLEAGPPLTIEERIATHPYAITPQPPFDVIQTAAGTGLGLTGPTTSGALIYFVWSYGPTIVEDDEIEADKLLERMYELIPDPTISPGKVVTFAGKPALRRAGWFTSSGVQSLYILYIAAEEGHLVSFVALIPSTRVSELAPIAEQIAASARPNN